MSRKVEKVQKGEGGLESALKIQKSKIQNGDLEGDLSWKTTFHEDNLSWKTTFHGRHLLWKMTFDGRQPLMEDVAL